MNDRCPVSTPLMIALLLATGGCQSFGGARTHRDPTPAPVNEEAQPTDGPGLETATAPTNTASSLTSLSSLGIDPTGTLPPEDGADVAQITFGDEGASFDPCVSRDGSVVVFASTQHRPTSDIYVKPVDGRVVTRLTSDTADDVMPSISPDGTRVAFASNRAGNWDVFVMPITGGPAVQITGDASHELHPSWSPDGNELVFCRLSAGSGRWELWTAVAETNSTPRFIGYGMFPQWSPVSGTGAAGADRIVFQMGRERGSRGFGIWALDYKDGQTGNLTEIAGSTEFALINPSWSPDGQRIVFASIPATQGSAWSSRPTAGELWMMNVDGTGKVRLTSGRSTALMPVWSGERLLFVSDRSGSENIWSMQMDRPVVASAGSTAGRLAAGKNGTAPGAAAHGERGAEPEVVGAASDGE